MLSNHPSHHHITTLSLRPFRWYDAKTEYLVSKKGNQRLGI